MISSAPPRALDPDDIDVTIADIVLGHAVKRGDAIAVEDDRGTLSYAELAGLAEQVAAAAVALKPGEGPIGILLPVSNAYIAAMLGLLARGIAYVPMDASFPAGRNRDIAADAGLKAIIVDDATAMAAADMALGLPQIVVPHMPTSGAPATLVVTAKPADVAVIFYTSGSTGRPKGVHQRHANILYEVLHHCWRSGLSDNDRIALVYSPSVSGSTRDIYGSLAAGARLRVVDVRRAGLGGTLSALAQAEVTILHSIPGLFRAMFGTRNAETEPLRSSVRLVHLISDRVLLADVELYRERFSPDCRLCIDLATTETYSYASWYLDHETVLDRMLVPVGYPRADMIVRLLDETGDEVAPGALGEIIVSGRSLSLGYWKAPDLTAERFAPSSVLPGGTDFLTGDMGRLLPGGLLELVGRKDRQVKLSGNTIHLAEVEAVLARCPGVVEAGVLARGAAPATRLIAYCVVTSETDAAVIARWGEARLASFMRPSEIALIDALPKLPGGKPDPAALAGIDAERSAGKRASASAHGMTLSVTVGLVWDAWEDILTPGSFDQDIAFGDAGGDSLKGLSLILQLENRLGQALPPTILNMKTRPSELIDELSSLGASVPLDGREDTRPLLLFFAGLYGADIGVSDFAQSIEHRFRFVAIDYRDGGVALDNSFSAERLFAAIDLLVERQGAERVWLLGYSYGGKIAVEAAGRLLRRGVQVDFVGVLDGLPRDAFLKRHSAAVRGMILGDRIERGRDVYGGLFNYLSGGAAQKLAVWLWSRRQYRLLGRLLVLLRPRVLRAAELRVRRAITGKARLAALGHIPTGPVPAKLWLFLSEEERFAPELYPNLGWDAYFNEIETRRLPGQHLDLLGGDAGRLLADALTMLQAGPSTP
ncbi:MAG: AMP-binding protein [Sphingomonas sp.]